MKNYNGSTNVANSKNTIDINIIVGNIGNTANYKSRTQRITHKI